MNGGLQSIPDLPGIPPISSTLGQAVCPLQASHRGDQHLTGQLYTPCVVRIQGQGKVPLLNPSTQSSCGHLLILLLILIQTHYNEFGL